jgi:hypothetical protein
VVFLYSFTHIENPRKHSSVIVKALEINMLYLPFFLSDLNPKYIEALFRQRDASNLPILAVLPYASRGAEGMRELKGR